MICNMFAWYDVWLRASGALCEWLLRDVERNKVYDVMSVFDNIRVSFLEMCESSIAKAYELKRIKEYKLKNDGDDECNAVEACNTENNVDECG